MSAQTGIWIDKKQAFIVILNEGQHDITNIKSDIDFQVREEGEGKSYTRFGDQYGNHEKTNESKLKKQLNDYYSKVADAVTQSEALFIFGPAEAKNELKKLLDTRVAFNNKKIDVATSDSLTENQIVAAVKEHFNV
ncbi:hypothetical protein [Leptobacterium sp. I13]|uniref:hypothetical protein n=1 Tax=Leptobacterium meishanense TaxID=3128904 RepID=UPI0030EDAF07